MYFLTLCCLDGRQVFTDAPIVESLLQTLKLCCQNHGFKNYVYCFMPDHLHLLVQGEEKSDPLKMVKEFKQLTGYYFKKNTGGRLWQKSYHDHILRKEEDAESVVRYILENPVRKALVDQTEDYPFSGSLEFGKEIFKM
ncbi:MAG: transposase [Candidatus Zixiibacteriota bacterium]|nr:MAG: transposase [candidate division Zixibacteria bacterium]